MDSHSNSLWFNVLMAVLVFVLAVVLPWLIKQFQKGKSINPVDEANIYLVYGQREQAMNVLREACAADPDNKETLARLREIERK